MTALGRVGSNDPSPEPQSLHQLLVNWLAHKNIAFAYEITPPDRFPVWGCNLFGFPLYPPGRTRAFLLSALPRSYLDATVVTFSMPLDFRPASIAGPCRKLIRALDAASSLVFLPMVASMFKAI